MSPGKNHRMTDCAYRVRVSRLFCPRTSTASSAVLSVKTLRQRRKNASNRTSCALGFLPAGGEAGQIELPCPEQNLDPPLGPLPFRRGGAAHCRDQSCFVPSVLEIPRI